ncbi:uncharacterized protein DS421_13g416970 [Arachis hypogaea]|nr:uncharacterized protein DS421_13g416970 [Arachis hypogaea]
MEFNSSYNQTNFMGYYPPSPISNGSWEYHQEMINDQANYMRYCPEPQNDLCHYPQGSWTYQQEYEQSSEVNYFSGPQSDSYCYDIDINCGWEGNFNILSSVHQGTSSFDCAVNAYMENCFPMPQDDSYCDEFNNSSSCAWENQNQKVFDNSYSTYQELSSLEQTFNSFMESCQTSPPSFSSENSSSLNYPLTQNLFQNSQSSQTSMNQNLSRLETMLERYEREAQRSWKEQENSLTNMEMLLAQLLSAKKKEEGQDEEASVSSEISMEKEVVEVFEPVASYSQKLIEVIEEHETSLLKDLMEDHVKEEEEANQGSSHSIEAENYRKEELTEPSIQKALDKDKTPIITQQPSLESKEVKATSKSTNSIPNPARKFLFLSFISSTLICMIVFIFSVYMCV